MHLLSAMAMSVSDWIGHSTWASDFDLWFCCFHALIISLSSFCFTLQTLSQHTHKQIIGRFVFSVLSLAFSLFKVLSYVKRRRTRQFVLFFFAFINLKSERVYAAHRNLICKMCMCVTIFCKTSQKQHTIQSNDQRNKHNLMLRSLNETYEQRAKKKTFGGFCV